MRKNIGTIDSFLRIFIGLFLFGHAIRSKHGLMLICGAFETASGIARFCPCYKLFGVSTTDNCLHSHKIKQILQ